ncbi:copper amine oxidase N-terminal domain-containing protein [Paenibacillus sp. 1P07SE]|uniref:copper amine oxidase N-terminal domain-containing protein n=1 Tax=Paenibacillus sp. 1P07SE TaxID=3132209 RepID=UPI0039A43C5B
MRKTILLVLVFVLMFSASAAAHSGRTDSRGGHNCSEKSKAKGLCTGYHYHNGGAGDSSSKSNGSTSGSSTTSKSSGTNSSGTSSQKQTSAVQTSDIIIYINDKRFYPEPKPIVAHATTMLPIRSIGEALGAQVNWDKTESAITITKQSHTVKLKLSSKQAHVNGKETALSTAPILHKDAVFAPIRVVAEGVGAKVHFDSGANTLYITY